MQMPSSVSTRLQYQHKSLVDIIDGLTDEQVRLRPDADKWSIFENIVHLQSYQHNFITRVRALLETHTPKFDPYRAEADPLFLENCDKSTREVMQDLLTTRKEMAAGILSFPEHDLDKTAIHATYGEMNLLNWLHFFLLHEAHHLFTIFKMKSRLMRN